jgi:aquaporin NIP
VGTVVASLVLSLLFMKNTDLGQTLPSGSMIQSLVFEIILTFFLIFVILCVATGSREKGIMAGSTIGAVVGMEAMFGGPVSGASMNPARSLGPALVSLNVTDLWIYLTAPFVGSLLAVAAFRIVRINN